LTMAGVLTAGSGNLTNLAMDVSDDGVLLHSDLQGTGTYTSTDAFGSGAATLPVFNSSSSDGCPSIGITILTFQYYVVNSTTARFVENDQCGITAGSFYLQPSGNITKSSVNGTYGFTLAGWNPELVSAVAAGGLITANGNGGITAGTMDINNAGSFSSLSVPSGSTYTMNSNGRGQLTFKNAVGGMKKLGIYITQTGLLICDMDGTNSSPVFTISGSALPQSGSLTFSGNYGMNFDSIIPNSGEEDPVGQVVSDGVSAISGNSDVNIHYFSLSGTAPPPVLSGNVSTTGSFSANSSGRYTGSLNVGPPGSLNEVFYVINSSTVLLLESDSNGEATGIFQLQNLPQ